MMPAIRTKPLGEGPYTIEDTRTLAEAKAENIARLRDACDSEIAAAMPMRVLANAAFGVIAAGDASYDSAKSALTALRTKLASKVAAVNSAITSAQADGVVW